MKPRSFLLIVLLCIQFVARSQETPLPTPDTTPPPPITYKWPDTTQVIDFVNPEPEFPGGPQAMWEFIADNTVYPPRAIEDSIEGKVHLAFVVDSTGKVTEAHVRRGVHPLLDEEALRVLNLMPDWIPAEANGKPVNMRMMLPILFTLADGEEPEK